MRSFIINLTVSLLVTLIFLVILEFVFRLFSPQDLSGSWRTISEKGYMLNKASWESKHELHGRVAHYKFNRFHQRAPEVNKDSYTVLTLGDSFTFGWLLEEDKTYVGLIQSYADKEVGKDKIQVLNAGAGGWGLADFYDYLTEYGDSVRPNMVLVYFNTDDIGRSLNRAKYFNSNSKGASLKKKFNDSKMYQWFLEHSHLVQWVRNRLVNMSQKTTETAKETVGSEKKDNVVLPGSELSAAEVDKGVKLAEEIFEKINKWCKYREIPLVVLTTGWQFEQVNSDADPELMFLREAPTFFAKLDSIPFKDITPMILESMKGKNKQDYIIQGDYHPNEKGAELISQFSWNFVKPVILQNIGLAKTKEKGDSKLK